MNILKKIDDWLHKPTQSDIEKRVLEHRLSLVGKYDTPEFKALPHIDQFSTIIFDSIIPDLYKRK